MEEGPFYEELAALYLGDLKDALRWAGYGRELGALSERRVLCAPFLVVL